LCGAFVWARRALNRQKHRFPARAVVGNWLYRSAVDQREQCSAVPGNVVAGTVNITEGALPAEAQAVVAAAGPRVK
jgi:hypothetical protein